MTSIFSVFFLAFISSLIITPVVKKVSLKFGFIDPPSDRKVHTSPIPHLGGVAICLGALLSVQTIGQYAFSLDFRGMLLGAFFILVLGIIDDVLCIRPLVKLFGQVFMAWIPVSQGVVLSTLSVPFVGSFSLGIMAVPVTIFFVISIINTINLIDGLDGLAAGISFIAAAVLALVSFQSGHMTSMVLMLAVMGSTLGFLCFNFPPASIFMGDTGSMFLGYMLGLVSVRGVMAGDLSWRVFVPILVLGIPILDMLYAILRRFKNKQAIFKPDKGHFHHELLHSGLTQKQIALFSYFVTAVLGILSVLLYISTGMQQVLMVGLSVLLIGSGLVLFKKNRKLIFRVMQALVS